MTTVPLANARDTLSRLIDDVARTHDTVTITRNGVPAAMLIAADDYESIMETLALLNEPEDRRRLLEAEQSVETGDVVGGDEMAELMTRRTARS